MKPAKTADSPRCSFCHKSQDVVEKLVTSPSDYPRAYICSECIGVCNLILNDENVPQHPVGPQKSSTKKIPVFQTIYLPPEYSFSATEVYIRRDPQNGDVILSRVPGDAEQLESAQAGIPPDFLTGPKKN